jgi:ankyrin repeat protein
MAPLHIAATFGRFDALTYLISIGAKYYDKYDEKDNVSCSI